MATIVRTDFYVLKDQDGQYVGDNSISYDKPTKQYFYSWSEFLTNGFYTYPTESQAQEGLKTIQEIANKIKFDINFHIEKIDLMKILLIESKMNIPKHPFVHKRISINMEVAVA